MLCNVRSNEALSDPFYCLYRGGGYGASVILGQFRKYQCRYFSRANQTDVIELLTQGKSPKVINQMSPIT